MAARTATLMCITVSADVNNMSGVHCHNYFHGGMIEQMLALMMEMLDW